MSSQCPAKWILFENGGIENETAGQAQPRLLLQFSRYGCPRHVPSPASDEHPRFAAMRLPR
jgi:hypothetical protein